MDPDFVLGGGSWDSSTKSVSFSLKRKPFLRIASLIFLGIGIAFVFYLVGLNRQDELNEFMKGSLGFFGTLWGLRAILVPETIKVFPTLVDYVILGAFCCVFFLVAFRVHTRKRGLTC